MRNVKHVAAWHISVVASLASLLVLLAWALPQQLKAADLSVNFTRLVGDFSGVAYKLQKIELHSGVDGASLGRLVAVNSGGEDKTTNSLLGAHVQFEPANGVLAGRQLELTWMQRDEDGQQGTAKFAPKPEQRPMPPAGPQKQQPHRNIRSGMRIPEHQFRSKFGRQHTFQIQQLNRNRFQAGGFLFEVVDVWPAVFSFEDPFFIDESDDQFFLFDVNQPGVRTLIVIVQEL